MRRVLQAVSLVVCLAVAAGAPRGLLLAALAAAIGMVHTAYAQQPEAAKFDVVSIKANTTGAQNSSLRPEPNGVTGINVTAMRLFRVAYQAADFQIVDVPSWFNSERFDVTARTSGPVSQAELGTLVRSLLADRFGLRVERTTRDMRVFELHVDRPGAAGLKSTTEPCSVARRDQVVPGAVARQASRPCFSTFAGELHASGVTMEMLARELTGSMGQQVLDRTALGGFFDFDLRWSVDAVAAAAAADADAPPLVTAVREQLGLRLTPARADVDVYVIAAAHRPGEN